MVKLALWRWLGIMIRQARLRTFSVEAMVAVQMKDVRGDALSRNRISTKQITHISDPCLVAKRDVASTCSVKRLDLTPANPKAKMRLGAVF